MNLCVCKNPLRDTAVRDRLRCSACSGWTPFGNPLSVDRFTRKLDGVDSLLARTRQDYLTIVGVGYGLTHRNVGGVGASPGPSDPTLAAVENRRRARTRTYAVLASRILERALADLRRVDEALGDALYDGPAERAEGSWCEGDPTLLHADAVEAQGRRAARGEVAL